jgi:hypothetical protein
MPKKAYLAPYLSTFELKKRYQQSKNSIESRRWHLNRENSSRLDDHNATTAA